MHLLQNILLLVFVILLITQGPTVSSSDSKDTDTLFPQFLLYFFYAVLLVDIIAFFLLASGAFLFRSEPMLPGQLKTPALIAGITALLWAILTLLWRFILPYLTVGMFLKMFSEDLDVDRFLMLIKLIFLFATIASVIYPVIFFSFRKLFVRTGELYRVKVKKKLLSLLLVGSILNMLINFLWQIPFLMAFMGGKVPEFDAMSAFQLVVVMKLFVIPPILILGCVGLFKSGSEVVLALRSGRHASTESTERNVDVSQLIGFPDINAAPSPFMQGPASSNIPSPQGPPLQQQQQQQPLTQFSQTPGQVPGQPMQPQQPVQEGPASFQRPVQQFQTQQFSRTTQSQESTRPETRFNPQQASPQPTIPQRPTQPPYPRTQEVAPQASRPVSSSLPGAQQSPGFQPPSTPTPAPAKPVGSEYSGGYWTCPNCGAEVDAKYIFCTSCGYKKGG